MAQKVLVVGSGGREHALGWRLQQEGESVSIIPGNGGLAELQWENQQLNNDNVCHFAKDYDFVIIGPDDALAAGMVDALEKQGIAAFGPSQAAAQVEASKSYAKNLMQRYGIPCARSETFDQVPAALRYADTLGYPVAIKADGLALGKGVFLCADRAEAEKSLEALLVEARLGEAGKLVVVEEYLTGTECSVHALIDGHQALLLESVRDHKQAYDGNQGPNTGGMGTISPSPLWTQQLADDVQTQVLNPFLRAMHAENLNFRGLLFPGLMLTSKGLRVLEFNARFGDPETQVLMRRWNSSLGEALRATREGRLSEVTLEWSPMHAACVVMASKNYPESSPTGLTITGIQEAEHDPAIKVFHAGTQIQDAQLVTAGGRVLGVTALGQDTKAARSHAYEAVEKIHFEGACWRTDIGS